MAGQITKWLPGLRRRVMRTPGLPAQVATSARTSVLLECAPENSPMLVAAILDRADLDVIVCEGPKVAERCPVATGGGCAAVREADVVVNALGTRTPELAEVLPAVLHAGVDPSSVVVMGRRHDPAVAGVRQVGPHVRADELIDEVRAAAQRSPR